MTQDEALQEARRRWGKNVFVFADTTPEVSHLVGVRCYGEDIPEGIGDSWEAAFADADQREHEHFADMRTFRDGLRHCQGCDAPLLRIENGKAFWGAAK